MTIRNKFSTTLALVTAVGGLSLIGMGPADASTGHFTLIAKIPSGTHSCSFTKSVPDLDHAYTGCSISDDAYQTSNYDSVAWIVYDDKDYKDRKYCVRPGRLNVALSDRSMSSKVSSIKKLTTSSCAGYTQL